MVSSHVSEHDGVPVAADDRVHPATDPPRHGGHPGSRPRRCFSPRPQVPGTADEGGIADARVSFWGWVGHLSIMFHWLIARLSRVRGSSPTWNNRLSPSHRQMVPRRNSTPSFLHWRTNSTPLFCT